MTAAVVTANATFDDRQFTQSSEHLWPFGGVSQQLPRRGSQAKLIEQLFLRQAICQTRKNITVDEAVVGCQFARQRGFRPAFDFGGDHAVLVGHGFRFGVEAYRVHGDAQRFTGLA
ncbi:hypothetical protein D3C81_1543540 [compost metagenome]